MAYRAHKVRSPEEPPVQLVASVESARAMYNLGEIASWQSTWGAAMGGKLSALLVSHITFLSFLSDSDGMRQFAAEDCG